MPPHSNTANPLLHSPWLSFTPALTQGLHLPLLEELERLRSNGATIYPPQHMIFHALHCTPPSEVRVIILGQDPYHTPDRAMGLAFSVPDHMRCPPSLKNIFIEIEQDVYQGAPLPNPSPNLERWARQGVLLLNTVLSVEKGKAASHTKLSPSGGWQSITTAIMQSVATGRPVAALLWGAEAQKHAHIFEGGSHLLLTSAHPSPFSARPTKKSPQCFFGHKHFSKVNHWLEKRGEKPIQW